VPQEELTGSTVWRRVIFLSARPRMRWSINSTSIR
jgi:hypothetical protein